MRKSHFYVINMGRAAYFLILLVAVTALLYGRFVWKDYYETQNAISWAMIGKVLVIDAGHGGIDPGVVGQADTEEKDINLAIASQLGEILRQSGATVIMTRENDDALARSKREDLSLRIDLVEKNNPSLFISIHGNSYPRMRSLCGAQTFYKKGQDEGKRLAESIQAAIMTQLENTDRKALPHNDSYLLDNIRVPAVIVEVGFLSNPEEEKILNDSVYQWQMAEAIYRGIVDYYTADDSDSEVSEGENGN